MGIFSQNYRPGFNNYVVEAAEGYGGPGAAAKIMIECQQNDMALFKGLISSDFHAAYAAANGSVTESTLITEGAVADFFKKIKEMFLKLIEKIKGLVKSFMTKFAAVFVKDGKELVNKYSKQIKENIRNKKMKMDEMTYKMHEGVTNYINGKKVFAFTFNENDLLFKSVKTADKASWTDEQIDKEAVTVLNKLGLQCSEPSDLNEELRENYIGDIEEEEGYNITLNSKIEEILKGSAKLIRDAESAQRKAEKLCNNNIKEADKKMSEASKKYSDLKGDEDVAVKTSKEWHKNLTEVYYKFATLDQAAISTIMSFQLEYLKTIAKDARSLYIKAASRRAVAKEDAVLFDVIDEANAYEVDMMFDCPISENYSYDEIMDMIY